MINLYIVNLESIKINPYYVVSRPLTTLLLCGYPIGLSEESQVQTPAFTDAVRLYRQAHGQYGTWEMMCGIPSQVSNATANDSLCHVLV